jgi:hypothetical protein
MTTQQTAAERFVAGRVQLTRLLWGPREYHVAMQYDQAGRKIELDVEFDGEQYRYLCRRLAFDATGDHPPITAETLRDIKLSAVIFAGLWPQLLVAEPAQILKPSDPEKAEVLPAGAGATMWTPLPPISRGRPAELTDEVLREVGALYTAAYVSGLSSPMKTVMQTFDLPRATAGRWVAKARTQGLLGKTSERKAGGVE